MRYLSAIIILLFLANCSVGMALKGTPDPNVGVLELGQSRDVVILNLGQPSQTYATEEGRTDIFNLERGNAPSPGRAMGHATIETSRSLVPRGGASPLGIFNQEDKGMKTSYGEGSTEPGWVSTLTRKE